MGWSRDEREWLDEEIDASDVVDRKYFLESVFFHAPVASISK
jgi:hypothetical protein